MQFLTILTFLHIWINESQGYLKMQGPWQFLQNKGSYCTLKKVELERKMKWSFELQVPSSTIRALFVCIIALHIMAIGRYQHGDF